MRPPGWGSWRGRLAGAPARTRLLVALLLLTQAGCATVTGGPDQLTAATGPAAAAVPAPGPEGSTGAAGSPPAAGPAASCPAPSPATPGLAESHLPLRSLCALPPEAGQVWHVIVSGARSRYPRDGIVFGNLERRLPRHDRGYYHEFTVPTPGSRDRGARRLITGSGHELYYTADHYGSFVVVDSAAERR